LTARSASRRAPIASRDFFVGRWHVDQSGQGATTDMDWRDDGTCEGRNIFSGGTHALDVKADVCTWKFEKISDSEFVVDYTSEKLTNNVPKRMSFKIVNPIRIRNVEQNYEAFRIVCPAQELVPHQKALAASEQLAARDPRNLGYQHDLADKLQAIAAVLADQEQYQAALAEYMKGLTIRRNLALSDAGNQGWQRDLAANYEQIGQFHAKLNERAPALDFFTRSLPLRQALADADRDNVGRQAELVLCLYLISTVSEAAAAKEAAAKALAILDALERNPKLTAGQTDFLKRMRAAIERLL
jgi:tetratricopeptide (TPR) repeat protein